MEGLSRQVMVLLFIAVLFFPPSRLSAEDVCTAKPLSRSKALSLAISQHPRLKVSESRKEAAVERITQAKSGYLPQLAFTERYSRTDNPMWAFGTKLNQETITREDFDPSRLNDPGGVDNFVSMLSMQWSIYNGGRTGYGTEQAVEGAAAADLELEQTRQQVIAVTAIAYDGLLLAQARLQVIDQAITLAEAHLRLVTERYGAGLVVKSDVLRAQVRRMDLKQKRYAADSQVSVAIAALSQALGDPPERRYQPTDDLTMTTCKFRSLTDWVGMGLVQRPELKQMQKKEVIAEREMDIQHASHLPSIGLFGNYEINSEGFSDSAGNYTVGAMIQVPIFSGFRDVSKVREARLAIEEVKASRHDLRSGIELEIRQAFHDACSANERIGVAESAVDLAEENRGIVADRYQNGLLTIVELLDAETTLEQARMNRFQALYDFRTAYVRLLLAAGAIPGDL
jgi:outer membrane protein